MATEACHKERALHAGGTTFILQVAFLHNPFPAVWTNWMGAKSRTEKSEGCYNNAARSQGPQMEWSLRDAKPRGSKGEVAPLGTAVFQESVWLTVVSLSVPWSQIFGPPSLWMSQ